MDQKERDGQKGNGQTLVTPGTILGTVPLGTAKRMVSRWIHGQLLNLFLISVQSVCKPAMRSSPSRTVCSERDKPRSCRVPRILHMRIDSRVLRKVKMNFLAKIAFQCTRQMLSANSGLMNEVMDVLQIRVH